MRPVASLKYLTDGEELFVITDDRQKILQAMERQFVVSLAIGSLVRNLDRDTRRALAAPRQDRIARRLAERTGGAV
jgi:hypothetical protein